MTACIRKMDAHPISNCRVAVFCMLCVLLAWFVPVFAQPIAWPVGSLRPPGLDQAKPMLVASALSGEFAFTGFAGDAAHGFRVYVRLRDGAEWSQSILLAQGQDASDNEVTLAADSQRLALGAPDAGGVGAVSIYMRDPGSTGWVLEQVLQAPTGAYRFGKTLSLRGNLLVVTSGLPLQDGNIFSYRFDSASGAWIDAGFTFDSMMFGELSAVTDGQRIAYCVPMLLEGCMTAAYSAEQGWRTEARPDPWLSQGTKVLALSADQLFVTIGNQVLVLDQVGSEWHAGQQIPVRRAFSLAEDSAALVVSQYGESQIYQRDVGGVWQIAAQLPVVAESGFSAAIAEDLALIGSQAFAHQGNDWTASGDTAGIFDSDGMGFGLSLQLTSGHLWVGAPGFDAHDQEAGSLWVYPAQSAGAATPADLVLPGAPGLLKQFGMRMASDHVRVAVYGNESIWIVDATNHQTLQRFELPQTTELVWGAGVAIDGNLLVVSRKFQDPDTCASQVLVYRDSGAGFELAQTIDCPAGAPSNTFFGYTVHVRGDWLLSGKLMFRHETNAGYQYVGPLWRPSGISWTSRGIDMQGDQLAVATRSSSRGALIYIFDNTNGWVYSGSVWSGAFSIGNGCLNLAIQDTRLVCTDGSSANSREIFLAFRDVGGSDWSVVGTAPIPDAALDLNGTGDYQLAWLDDQIAIGTSDTPTELAGTRIGHVQFMTLEEAIFRSGFD